MYYVKIYGSNTLVAPDSRGEALRSTVATLGDVVAQSYECFGIYLDLTDESEELAGGGGAIALLNKKRQTFSIPLQGVALIDYRDLLDDLKTLLAKKYWYMGTDYANGSPPYLFTSTSDYLQVIGSLIKEETESVGALKFVTLTAKHRSLA